MAKFMPSPPGVTHNNTGLQLPGQIIGTGIGSFFGMPGFGVLGGNIGQQIGDLAAGNTKGYGWDLSQNLPPGFQAPGMGGILNSATGLPLAGLFGMKGH